MTTQIKEYDRSGFEGMKFQFVCDDNFLTVQETPQQAIQHFIDFNGHEPKTVMQSSRYPSFI